MKTRLLIIIGIIFSGGFVIANAYADCDINYDWPDAPCMDQGYQQHQVNKWAEYYDYKGEQFMESKRTEMNNAIKSNQLMKWMDESIQNQNAWQYYYFSGQAPNPYPYSQEWEFEPISRDSPHSKMTPHNPFWYMPYLQWIYGITITAVVIGIIVLVWRNRK